jgi:DNA-binding NtrC family response regulator
MMPLELPRVLCVDDDASVLAALRRLLRGRFDVVLANGATEGLARLRDAGPFAVVMSDLNMPGIDGHAFLAEARLIAPRTVGVLMTGSCEHDVVMGPGVSDLIFRRIDKPCRPDVLWASLEAAVAHHSLDAGPR